MKILNLVVVLTTLASGCNYSHVGPSMATFSRVTPSPDSGSLESQTGPLVLRIRRHLDTVLHGPDTDEDQLLVLEVHDFLINQKLPVPSDRVTAEFTVTRFGPSSKGQEYSGYLIVKKITPTKVDAYLHLDVIAVTTSGSYTERADFHGNFTFIHNQEGASEP